MTIDDALMGRENNFNLLRFIAAFTVLVSHVSLLKWGEGGPQSYFELYVGDAGARLAVDAFFIMSGFLVSKSLLSRASMADYLIARGLRLFPALIVLSLLVAYGLGVLVSREPAWHYLTDWETTKFWLATSLTFSESQTLPGVFGDNPVPGVVIGPLWTLKWEVLAYGGLLALWLTGVLSSRLRLAFLSGAFFSIYLLGSLANDVPIVSDENNNSMWTNLFRFGSCFLLGTLCYLYRDCIPLKLGFAASGLVAAILLRQTALFDIVSAVALAYAVFWFALVPKGVIRNFNNIGDYSYGIYIYHWPIIQALVALDPEISPLALLGMSSVTTLAAATLSWHLLESPVLSAHSTLLGRYKKRAQTNRPGETLLAAE